MSFGFSIGDFLAVTALAKRMRKELINAPRQLKNITDEVRSLSIVLHDTEIIISTCEIDGQQKASLREIITGCYEGMLELEKTIKNYRELEHSSGNVGKRIGRVWKRLNWEPEDVRELRDRLSLNITLLGGYIGQISSQATFAVRKGVERLNKQQDNGERLTILDWLTPIDYAPQQSDCISRRQPGTGQWLLDSPEFQMWLRSGTKTLFCPGIPGAGKTILTSIIIDELTTRFEADETVCIGYIFCNFRRKHEQRAEDLLASLLKQMAQTRPPLPEAVTSLYERHARKRTRPSYDEISKALQTVAKMFSTAFIVIDALDECQTSDACRRRFLGDMLSLVDNCGVSFLATSRYIPDISDKFAGSTSVEIRASAEDVQRYVAGHLSRLPPFVGRTSRLKEEIVNGIVTAVDGMFLLAQLYLDSLIGKRSPKAVRTALAKLPSGSDAYDYAYWDAMERIEGQVADEEELAKQHALAVEFGEHELDEENITQLEDMVSVCAGLVTVDEESSIIRLAHYTTQEFFERTQQQWFPNAEDGITRICATYLSFTVFETGACPTDASFEERLGFNPFYQYAAQNWGHHACDALTLHQDVIEFLQHSKAVEASSQALNAAGSSQKGSGYSQTVPKHMTGLHLAAYFGVKEAVKALLGRDVDADSKATNSGTPLFWATSAGHEAIVKRLLETKSLVNADFKDTLGRTPLLLAAHAGHDAIVELLLATEGLVNANSKDDFGRTPLLFAALKGHEAIVRLLLTKQEVNADSKDNYGRTPLLYAAQQPHEAIVKLLLTRMEVNASSKDQYGHTPLSHAACAGHRAVVELLLANTDIDADSKDNYDRTPLSWAARKGHYAIFELLMAKKEVNADSKDTYGRTPLSHAAGEGHGAIVELLLARKDVDADSKDNHSRTPLSWTARKGHHAISELLLATERVDAGLKDDYGYTPLSWVAGN